MEKIELNIDDKTIQSMSNYEFKKIIKNKVRCAALTELKKNQDTHSKVRDILFEGLSQPQHYLISANFNYKLSSLLFNLRCRTVKDIRLNFKTMYQSDVKCPICLLQDDTQEHLLQCKNIIFILNITQTA